MPNLSLCAYPCMLLSVGQLQTKLQFSSGCCLCLCDEKIMILYIVVNFYNFGCVVSYWRS